MTKPDLTENELDQLFETARQSVPVPDDAFLARITADAEAFAASAAEPVAAAAPKPWLWSQVAGVFGGWGGMSGLVAATVAGVWIGIAPPSDLLDPAGLVATSFEDTGSFDEFLSFSDTAFLELEDG